ncbi:hypothetical protein BJX68DRAFT_237045 [Aspergillus pseudodeflectus]|uniref:Zn(2)-C6 fungal-type domain-containing protein n=1 Tax=Aspergillus pseudodeflectus TaxID=176178 RepID=A0ABR4KE11_9EURO
MSPQMPNACLPCAAKKRKCDRAFPKCSRCSQSKIHQECVYRSQFGDQISGFGSGQLVTDILPLKSGVSCEKCRVGKRGCSRDLPTCSRCGRLNIPCHYDLGGDYSFDQASRATSAQASPVRVQTPKSSDNYPPSPQEWSDHPDISLIMIQRTQPPLLSPYGLQYKPKYPIPERDYFADLIHFYTQICFIPPLYRVENSLTTHLHTFWMSRALADPCLFMTVLFSALAHRDSMQGIPHSPQTLYHQSLALRMLHKQLNAGKQVSYEMAGSALSLTFYNMSGYNTDTALIHRNGLLQMLDKNKNQGPDFQALGALVNLIVLGLSVVVHQEPSVIPNPNTSLTRIDPFTFDFECLPSNLLRRAVVRVAENQNRVLRSDTVSDLHDVLDFIIVAEHVSFPELLPILHARTAVQLQPPERSPGPEPRIPVKTAEIISECCKLATRIFWFILQSSIHPNGTSTALDSTIPRTAIKILRDMLQRLDMVSWKKNAPEAYLWICFTVAAACDKPAGRVPFVTAVTPILSASDTMELNLARECWRYYRWLSGFTCLWIEDTTVD